MTENTNPFDEANDKIQDAIGRWNKAMDSARDAANETIDPRINIDPRDVTMNAIANILFPQHRGTDYGQPAGGFTGRNAADPNFDPAEYTVPRRPAGTPADLPSESDLTVAEANEADQTIGGRMYVRIEKLVDAQVAGRAHAARADRMEAMLNDATTLATDRAETIGRLERDGRAHADRADAAEQKIAALEADVARSNQHILSARRETRDALEKCAQYVTALSQILEAHDQRILMYFRLPEPEHSQLTSFVNLVGERANIVVTIARDALGLNDDLVDAEIDEDDAFAMPFEPGDTVVLRSNPPSDIDGIPLIGVIRSIRDSGFGDTQRIDVDWANGARGACNDSELKHYNTDDK